MYKDKKTLGAWVIFLLFVLFNIITVKALLNPVIKPVTQTVLNPAAQTTNDINELIVEKFSMRKSQVTVAEAPKTQPVVTATKKIFVPDAARQSKPASSQQLASRSSSTTSGNITLSISGMKPVCGILTSGFGWRGSEFHKGIDIGAPTGTDVYAFADGKVTFSGWDTGGYGNLVIVDHGNGIETYYGHNSKLLVNEGAAVTKGQVIANIGKTGDATGPHCHFELRKDGIPVNPINYIR
jgi:murein DD-endopeptidase MepM/ murein hydrolase activator NlpD